ncbi:S8 family peptidase [Methanospirillum lacunae]|uniref:S8 family peptidase n=1 Tax=Methanospirillum lacunae TaxID=668570 RepID=UPI0015E86AB4|nr:S8 family serine peptidase [Methanospirillum lacunae]
MGSYETYCRRYSVSGIVLIISLLICWLIPLVIADQINPEETERVILYTAAGVPSPINLSSLNNSAVSENCTVVLRAPQLNFLVVEIPVNNSSFYQNELLKISGINNIEPDPIRIPDFFSSTPVSNVSISEQWAFNRTDFPQAWTLLKPGLSSPVSIAIIDTGVDSSHPELKPFINQHGFDWVDNSTIMQDVDGHGTYLAGIVCAIVNGDQNSSTERNLTIIPERVGTNATGIYASRSAVAIQHAADNGAKIILMGYGGSGQCPAEEAAISYALSKGSLLIAPAGNEASNEGHYPSDYDGVISVGSTAKTDGLSYYSNYGIFVDLVAPGEGVLSVWPDNTMRTGTGTSPSTALVTGAAALISSVNPDLNKDEIRSILESTSHDLGRTGRDIYYGYGLLDAGVAVAEAEKQHTNVQSSYSLNLSSGLDQIKRSGSFGKGIIGINLSPGWNFVSVPSFPASGKTGGDLFQGINTDGHTIWKYNAVDQDWVAVEKQTNLTPLEGFLLYSDRQSSLPLVLDNRTKAHELNMSCGWNLVGLPNMSPMTAKDALSPISKNWVSLLQYNSTKQNYDPAIIPGANGSHSDSRMLSPFSAYWVYMNAGAIYHPV